MIIEIFQFLEGELSSITHDLTPQACQWFKELRGYNVPLDDKNVSLIEICQFSRVDVFL